MGRRTAVTTSGTIHATVNDSSHEPDLPRRRAPAETDETGGLAEQVPLVVTGDLELLDDILAATAAAGVEPSVTSDPASIRPVWVSAPMVIVGLDQVQHVAELVLPRRTEVYVVGGDENQQRLWQWSATMSAAVLTLPSGASLLTAAIADLAVRPSDGGSTVAVIGASGGVGASTIAAGLCAVAGASDVSSMLVDLDPSGGGIDLLIGAESMPGWRWPRLTNAQGHVGDLTGHLPRIAGIDVLSTSRDASAAGTETGADAIRAVLMSARRSHRLIVADLPKAMTVSSREVVRHADHTLLVVAADVRGIAAAQQLSSQLRLTSSDLRLVARMPRSGGVDAGMVSDTVQLPLAGILGEDSSLRLGAERGEPPGRSARGAVAKLARRLLAGLSIETGSK